MICGGVFLLLTTVVSSTTAKIVLAQLGKFAIMHLLQWCTSMQQRCSLLLLEMLGLDLALSSLGLEVYLHRS